MYSGRVRGHRGKHGMADRNQVRNGGPNQGWAVGNLGHQERSLVEHFLPQGYRGLSESRSLLPAAPRAPKANSKATQLTLLSFSPLHLPTRAPHSPGKTSCRRCPDAFGLPAGQTLLLVSSASERLVTDHC